MKSSLKERLGQLGPVRVIDQVSSGIPAPVVIRRARPNGRVNTIAAAHALARRGLPMLKTKRVIERVISEGRAVVILPRLESREALRAELADAGFQLVTRQRFVDVQALRLRLKLTQEQFAVRFGIPLDTLQNWEQKRGIPDVTHMAYLRSIERAPEAVEMSQDDEL